MTKAPIPGSRGTRSLEAPDPRADGRRRLVLIDCDRVVISRTVAGVRMRISLAPRAFRGIVLRLVSLDEVGFRYEIRLAHDDPDLAVPLVESNSETEAHAQWRHWARFLGLPRLVERVEGTYELIRSTVPGVMPGARRRGRGRGSKRVRFLTRRKVGRLEFGARIGCD